MQYATVHEAAIAGDVNALSDLTAPGQQADVNSLNEWGLTPVQAAVDMAPSNSAGDYPGVVSLLLSRGAELSAADLALVAEYLLPGVREAILLHPRAAELTAADLARAALSATDAYIEVPSDHVQVLEMFERLYTATLQVDPAEAHSVLMSEVASRLMEADGDYSLSVVMCGLAHMGVVFMTYLRALRAQHGMGR
jgi:hypothetical protein